MRAIKTYRKVGAFYIACDHPTAIFPTSTMQPSAQPALANHLDRRPLIMKFEDFF